LFCCRGDPSRIRIPGSVREIADNALSGLGSLTELSFEEGTVKVGVSAFRWCRNLHTVSFPASLTVIEAEAFSNCSRLRQPTLAVGSQLHYIRYRAFVDSPLAEVMVPASITEIDAHAFSGYVWQNCVRYEGQPLFAINDDFLSSLDASVMFC
jgi:hypothetical protein